MATFGDDSGVSYASTDRFSSIPSSPESSVRSSLEPLRASGSVDDSGVEPDNTCPENREFVMSC
ncbi:MAG: hypothetical protein UX09_C0018G0020 [Candidatus Uhrbacteria bacterium GW2011_GWE2_45_35]|uniref:Uncharacterized protein n=2 Tax=Candidatus Uhriibacteriota TaxID=1752732 RepID=A0A0G1JJE1_9BACT|nr:MAG: hypothetical protein UW63_C0010G0012 [Candidatus Uhrbacteria bacterium GW2011_GWF2_44_350]KKU08393.1 MAG: hypothetical protein UX09_C0018G0020 [Candidatus Uhrbacteria bacterium GW2011_GWE2_45_35]HBR80512.1 hypothetical protein [Candidatus Uhrbacteria bacterium]HCU31708.1 hypothetical protein [Candidatus Uhrbacteria bacterium]